MNAPAEEAEAHAKVSKRENRIYVGNLAYDVNYKDLEKFMSGAGGTVIFSEVLTTPAGQSKGCGIVEFETEDQAKQAKAELSDKPFMGRSVFIREDREETARFGAAPIPGKIGLALGEARTFLGQNGNPTSRNIYVSNLPLQASWQDLKDLMRQAGEVIRTDIGMTFDGRPKGSGTVVFVDPQGAKSAIEMFHGYDWFGNVLEVREDRFPNPPGGGRGRGGFGFQPGFRGGFAGAGMGMGRGGFQQGFGGRGGFQQGFGGRGGFGMGLGRGGFGRGGFQGGRGGFQGHGDGSGGRDFSNDLYADYNGGGNAGGANGGLVTDVEPNQQIYVRNLPWSTSNEDLVELFETVGSVVSAEILYDGQRSRGEGVVQFTETAEAQTAGEKFTGYMYGGRPLGVAFNKHWHDFSTNAAKGGQSAA